jgi:hypothetical protein
VNSKYNVYLVLLDSFYSFNKEGNGAYLFLSVSGGDAMHILYCTGIAHLILSFILFNKWVLKDFVLHFACFHPNLVTSPYCLNQCCRPESTLTWLSWIRIRIWNADQGN